MGTLCGLRFVLFYKEHLDVADVNQICRVYVGTNCADRAPGSD